ncbi:MAG: CapA family protein [Prevotella sp.]|nr:CapA family protein [Prevotella sp.]
MLLTALTLTAMSCRAGNNGTPVVTTDSAVVAEPVVEEHHLSLLFAGDLMQHGPQIKAAQRHDGSYDYSECFARVREEIERADVAIANLEVTLGGKPYTGYPQFRAPDDYLRACIDAGFDILTTANNHCCDSHRAGLERTIMMMDSLGVLHLGTYINNNVREETYPFLLEKNGLRVVLLNFTYDTNGIPVEAPNVVNLIDTVQIRADLERARQMQPDVIIALPHWGIEYQQLPSQEQRTLAEWLIDHGVDHVIGGHPHVAQPLELSDDSLHLVAWSMGNVISNQSRPNTYGGYMVRLDLTKVTTGDESRTRLSDCGYTLYWVSRPPDNGNRHNYRILSIDEPDSLLTGTEQRLRYNIRASMRRLMERHAKGIREYPF